MVYYLLVTLDNKLPTDSWSIGGGIKLYRENSRFNLIGMLKSGALVADCHMIYAEDCPDEESDCVTV